MRLMAAALVQLAFVLVPQAATDEDVVRGLVLQYYEAQTNKDPDQALGFWSMSANPRMSREGFVAVFAAGDAVYTPDIQSVTVKGSEARIRVAVAVARTVIRNEVPTTVRQTLLNAELWRREGASWKLLREGPFAEDVADELLAAPLADRPRILAGSPAEQNASLRYVLSQRATMAAAMKMYAKAREIFDLVLTVARASNDRRAEGDALQNIANAYYFMATTPGAPTPGEDFAKATDFYNQRLTLSRQTSDEEGTASSLLGLATVSYSRGEYTAALTSYREALAIYEKRDEGGSIGRTLVSVGNVQYLQAEYDEATASYRRALGLLVTGMDSQGAAFARNGLARVFAAQGDIAAALDMYGQVLSDARARLLMAPAAKGDVAAALESIGDLHFRLANPDQARASFDEARRLIDADPGNSARLFGSLGLTEIVAGRFDAALADYTESRTRFEAAQMSDGVAHAWVGIGFSHAAREKFADAITAYRTAIRMFEVQRHNESAGRAWLGLSIAQSGALDHPAALQSAVKVRGIAAIVKSADLAWRADVRVGDVLRKLARNDEAREAFQTAITTIDRLAAEAPVNPEARRQLEDSASAWSGLALMLAAQGDAPGALAAVEARHAHIRRVQLGGFQRDITRGMTADERTDEQAIVRELISTRAQATAERSMKKPDAARLERLEQQLATLVTKRADQQSRLYARVPELQQWRGLSPATFESLFSPVLPAQPGAAAEPSVPTEATAPTAPVLPKPAGEGGPKPGDRGLLVEYLVSDDETLIVSVASPKPESEGGPDIAATIVPLKHRDLATKIEQAMQAAVLKDIVEWRKKAMPLATVLIAPIAARLRDRDRVVIVPDDLLWKIPFEGLPVGEGDLSSQARISYATSLATLAAQRRAAERAAPPDLTRAPSSGHLAAGIAGAPAIPAAIRAQVALTSQSWQEPDAAASLATTSEIAKAYGDAATVKTAADATEAAVRGLLETSDVVHVGAPLQMSGPTPLFSSLLLAGGTDTPDNDGRWEAREWFNLDGRARVVVMPDASTFGAAGVGGAMDAVVWAAASAGVSALVVGRWPGDGFTVDAVLAALHAQLAKGVPVGEAWRAATVSARAKGGAAPAGWAGLRLVGGDPR